MKNSHILLLCILGVALVSSVVCQAGAPPKECCFKFYPNKVKKSFISSFYRTDKRCSNTGVILVTKKNIHICVDPEVPWVKNIMKTLA
ncbi:C-C motif chemokine 4 homolog [Anabas testudineus]|uniref:Chemokine interleukin-8-like domain-containing protein n=1 Tax=Anabas testudineus TaxID=64144 RepID=A0AAQ6IRL3_ANATE|nr:C-C motif chemokine 4 homolog [Anabas testudineus]